MGFIPSYISSRKVNKLAAGYRFVRGGRLRNGGALPDACSRITASEPGVNTGTRDANLLGAFTYQYGTNFSGTSEIATHYVVLACEIPMIPSLISLPRLQHGDRYRVRPG